MRLIDADKFKEEMGTETKLRRMICSAIDEQPTAYDIDKVVEELEEKSDDIPIQYEDNYEKGFDDGIGYAIDTVRKGGI